MDASSDSTSNFVYFISAGAAPIKIGVASDPPRRLQELQTAHYKQLHLLYTIRCVSRQAAFTLEAAFQRWYGESEIRGEWFDVTPGEISEDIQLLSGLAAYVVEIKQETSLSELERLIDRSEKSRSINARSDVFSHFTNNPSDLNLRGDALKALSARLGVSKSTLYEVRREMLKASD